MNPCNYPHQRIYCIRMYRTILLKRKFDEETQLWDKYDSGDCFCNDCDEPLNKESRNINPVRRLCVTREIKKDVTKDELIGSKKSDLIKGYDKI